MLPALEQGGLRARLFACFERGVGHPITGQRTIQLSIFKSGRITMVYTLVHDDARKEADHHHLDLPVYPVRSPLAIQRRRQTFALCQVQVTVLG